MPDDDAYGPDVRHDGDWRLYGWFPVVVAVGLLDLARRSCRRVLRRARRAASHALYEASCIVDPESRPASDLPERAAARWRARRLRLRQNGHKEAPIE